RAIPVARRVLVYQVDDVRPRLVLLGTHDDWDANCGCPPYAEDLDTTEWFSHPHTVSPVTSLPGTGYQLGNGYDIVAGRYRSLRSSRHLDWPGTLLVVKRAKYQGGRAMHITPAEISLINALVERRVS
ncbi:hypothetical protein C8T65DRAFT_544712, partial [Cerioporus squamosus]